MIGKEFAKALNRAYNKEPFRIKDILNHVNDNQVASKAWLLEKLRPEGSTVVLGGWYGYLANKLNCRSVDLDPGCKEYGKILYPDVEFRTDDMWVHIMSYKYNTYVCTSCEHLPQDELDMVNHIPGLWCLQSTNKPHDTHINTKESLDEFLADYNLEVEYAGELQQGDYKRWMVIGRSLASSQK